MKTIEERIDKLAEKFYTLRYEGESTAYVKTKSFMRSALTELAADLQAEKEKEVAELREARDDLEARLGAIERSHNCDGDGCAVCYELSRLPNRSALLDEVKRVLENVRGFEIIGERTRSKIDQLLTRLGGPHE